MKNEKAFMNVGTVEIHKKDSVPMTRISTKEANFRKFCEITRFDYIEPYTALWKDAEKTIPLLDEESGEQKQKYNASKRKPALENFANFLDAIFSQLEVTAPDKEGNVTVPITYKPNIVKK